MSIIISVFVLFASIQGFYTTFSLDQRAVFQNVTGYAHLGGEVTHEKI